MNDLISRAAALEALGECPYNRDDWPEEIQAVDDWKSHKEAIESIPAVDAAPVVHGKWREYHATVRGYGKIYYQHSCTPILYDSPYYYCPNCGAKMDEDKTKKEMKK
jgi:hypothetical protein